MNVRIMRMWNGKRRGDYHAHQALRAPRPTDNIDDPPTTKMCCVSSFIGAAGACRNPKYRRMTLNVSRGWRSRASDLSCLSLVVALRYSALGRLLLVREGGREGSMKSAPSQRKHLGLSACRLAQGKYRCCLIES